CRRRRRGAGLPLFGFPAPQPCRVLHTVRVFADEAQLPGPSGHNVLAAAHPAAARLGGRGVRFWHLGGLSQGARPVVFPRPFPAGRRPRQREPARGADRDGHPAGGRPRPPRHVLRRRLGGRGGADGCRPPGHHVSQRRTGSDRRMPGPARVRCPAASGTGRSEPGVAGLTAALAGYSVWVLFNFDWAPATGAFWLLAGTLWSACSPPYAVGRSPERRVGSRVWQPALATVLVVAATVFAVFPILADTWYLRGRADLSVQVDPLQAQYHWSLG